MARKSGLLAIFRGYASFLAAQKGTELHDFAARCIQLGQRLPKSKKTLNAYVNDAIGYKMTPEQVLYYSENCYGTTDAISFRNGMLRIHDLKTGKILAHMEQLIVYAALFCLEYNVKPGAVDMELRIKDSGILTKIGEGISDFVGKIPQAITKLKDWVKGIIDYVKQSETLRTAWENIKKFFEPAIKSIVDFGKRLRDALKAFFDKDVSGEESLWKKLGCVSKYITWQVMQEGCEYRPNGRRKESAKRVYHNGWRLGGTP